MNSSQRNQKKWFLTAKVFIVLGVVGIIVGFILYNIGLSPILAGAVVAGSLLVLVLGFVALMIGAESFFLE